jgi:hypothetical protein
VRIWDLRTLRIYVTPCDGFGYVLVGRCESDDKTRLCPGFLDRVAKPRNTHGDNTHNGGTLRYSGHHKILTKPVETLASITQRPWRPGGVLEIQLYSFSNLGARCGWWLTPRLGRFTFRKETRHSFYRRPSAPQGRFERVGKISPPPGFDPKTVQPVVSVYRLSYRGRL